MVWCGGFCIADVVARIALRVGLHGAMGRGSRAAEVHLSAGCFGAVELTSGIVTFDAYIVSATEAVVDGGTVVEEIAAGVAVAHDQAERVAAYPREGPIEIGDASVELPLPCGEHIAHVGIATHPEDTVEVDGIIDSEEVVEVDLVDGFVLRDAEAELIGHLVGEEECFLASLVEAHCCGGGDYHHHHCQGCHQAFHSGIGPPPGSPSRGRDNSFADCLSIV